MGREGERWRAVVEEHFGFLADVGFTKATVDDSNWWETSVTYLADTVALKISASNEDNRVELHLIQLVDSAVPEYPVWITEAPMYWMLLDNVIEARRPDLLSEIEANKGLTKKAVHHQLARFAKLLRDVAPDFVAGQTSAIEDGAKIVRTRAREHPQELTVHLPWNATDDVMAAEAANAAALVPPEVEVRVRRYRWRRRSRPRDGGHGHVA